PGRARAANCRVRGRNRLGQIQAGWDAAKIDGQFAFVCDGLEAADRPGNGHPPGVRRFSKKIFLTQNVSVTGRTYAPSEPYPATLILPSRWSLSSLTSASTISLTRSANFVFGAQPNWRLAFL